MCVIVHGTWCMFKNSTSHFLKCSIYKNNKIFWLIASHCSPKLTHKLLKSVLIKYTVFEWGRSIKEKKAKDSKEIAMFSSYQEYCFQFLVLLFNRAMDILSPEKDDQNYETFRNHLIKKKQLTRMCKKN